MNYIKKMGRGCCGNSPQCNPLFETLSTLTIEKLSQLIKEPVDINLAMEIIPTINKITYSKLGEFEVNFVDLGLPSGTLWADRNLGASAPEDAGLYFMWGDIVGHTASEGFNFDWGNGWDSTNKEFDPSSNYGQCSGAQITTDIPNDPRYDAAANMIGGGAHIPTRGDCFELETFCTRTWKAINGMNGWEFTGPNGNKIFLPAVGYFDGSEIDSVGSNGYYWESTLFYMENGCYLNFSSGDVYPDGSNFRYYGYSVRAVQ